MPLSVYVFIVAMALLVATVSVGTFHIVVWAARWVRSFWAVRADFADVFGYYWKLQFKRAKGK